MTEQERVDSILKNGGMHLQNFKKENITYDMCLTAVKSCGEAIYHVPQELRTEEIYTEACKKNGIVLRTVPTKYVKKEICGHAVVSDGLALEFVPDKYKSKELCLKAVLNNQLAYKFVPEEYIDVEFVLKAINDNNLDSISSIPKAFKKNSFYIELLREKPELIWYLPKSTHTAAIGKVLVKAMGYQTSAEAIKDNPELMSLLHVSLYDHDTCLEFVKSGLFLEGMKVYDNGLSFNGSVDADGYVYFKSSFDSTYSLKDILTWDDVIDIAIPINGNLLQFVKEDLITQELCLKAINSTGNSFKYVPDGFKTKELCELAVRNYEYNIGNIPVEFITQELCDYAISKSGYLLDDIPVEFRTKKICLMAVSDEGAGSIDEVPEAVIDKEICIAFLRNNRNAFHDLLKIPERFWDYEVCLESIKRDGDCLKYIPDSFKDYNMCLTAVRNDGSAAEFVPQECFTHELCLAVVEKGPYSFKFIPHTCLTEDVCYIAVSKCSNPYGETILNEVPEVFRTQKICEKAVSISTHSLKDVPEECVTEEMLLDVAKRACGRLHDNFPDRFRTKAFINKIIETNPSAESSLNFSKIVPLD